VFISDRLRAIAMGVNVDRPTSVAVPSANKILTTVRDVLTTSLTNRNYALDNSAML
jgi:hypothetical protein